MSFHVWRQTQTQSTIVNFYEEDMNILNPRRNHRGSGDGIFRMEFPLMQWLVAGVYKLIGNHLIITRIFMFVIGLFSILGVYKLLVELFKKEILAIIGAWAFNFSPSFFYYTISSLPDNLALCFSIWGIAFFFRWYNKRKNKLLIFSGILLSLAALCKLPFIIYFIVPFVHLMLEWHKSGLNKQLIANTIRTFGFIILPLAWYIYVIPGWNGNGIINGIFDNSLPFSTILHYLQHNLISTVPELLKNYAALPFFFAGVYFLFKNKLYLSPKFKLILAWAFIVFLYFLFEINMIADVHDYYLFPFYPLLFIVIAFGACKLLMQRKPYYRYITIFLLLILPVTCLLRMQIRWNPDKPGFNKDLLIYKNELREAVPKNSLVIAGNDRSHFIYFYYIDKKGWNFKDNTLTPEQLEIRIEQGAEYLYSDSRDLDENMVLNQYFDDLITQKGSVRVYKLKTREQISLE